MTTIPYLTWALWFIPVYLCIVLLMPGLKHLKEAPHKIGFGFLIMAIFIATALSKLGWIQNIAFYTLWTYIGLFYTDIKSAITAKKTQKYLLGISMCASLALYLLHYWKIPIDMQTNKFPPNIPFFIFSVVAMSIIILLTPLLDRVFDYLEKFKLINKFLNLYSTHSITIFLYQAFAFLFTIKFTNLLFPYGGLIFSVIKAVFCLLITLPICAIFALIFNRVEQLGAKLPLVYTIKNIKK